MAGIFFDISIQTFAQLANGKHMQVVNDIAPELKVRADVDLMLIVANNLVNNAIKYGTESGQIRISAKDKGEFVTVEVYNDSTPIPPDKISRLFKKFSRLDTPEKKKVKGTGLGTLYYKTNCRSSRRSYSR